MMLLRTLPCLSLFRFRALANDETDLLKVIFLKLQIGIWMSQVPRLLNLSLPLGSLAENFESIWVIETHPCCFSLWGGDSPEEGMEATWGRLRLLRGDTKHLLGSKNRVIPRHSIIWLPQGHFFRGMWCRFFFSRHTRHIWWNPQTHGYHHQPSSTIINHHQQSSTIIIMATRFFPVDLGYASKIGSWLRGSYGPMCCPEPEPILSVLHRYTHQCKSLAFIYCIYVYIYMICICIYTYIQVWYV